MRGRVTIASAAMVIAVVVADACAGPEPTGDIVGRVTDAARGPVAGAVVAAQLVPHRGHPDLGWGQAVADRDGRFAIRGLEPGTFNVMLLEAPGRPHATAAAVEGVRVKAGERATADLTAIEGRPLLGVVVDRGDGDRPVKGIRVGCRGPAQPRTGSALMVTETDERGRFAFRVPPGEHFVFVIDDPIRHRTGRRLIAVPGWGEPRPVYLLIWAVEAAPPALPDVAGGPRRGAGPATRPAEDRRAVSGRVGDVLGRPLAGILVAAADEPLRDAAAVADLDSSQTAATDREGWFSLAGVPRRKPWVTTIRPGDQPLVQPLPADHDSVMATYRFQPDERARLELAPVEDDPVPPREWSGRLTFVDLTPYGSDFLADGPGHPHDGNNLDRLPRGVHRLGRTYFRIGDRMVHVRGQSEREMPVLVGGIKVGARGRTLHLLHACQQKADAGTKLGEYVVRYADGSSEAIPIVYGRNLVDWWDTGTWKEDLPEARVVWTGSNELLDRRPSRDIKIGLWDVAWTNPKPDREIAAIDVVSAGSPCDPYLVAVTVERDR